MLELASYVARYASHPPISERRIASFDEGSMTVTWFYDPHEDDDVEDEEEKIGRQYITETAEEFVSRLLIHVPDKGFQQIRYYGFYSNKCSVEPDTGLLFTQRQLAEMAKANKWREGLIGSFGYDPIWCKCGAIMELNYEMSDFSGGDG